MTRPVVGKTVQLGAFVVQLIGFRHLRTTPESQAILDSYFSAPSR